MTCPHTTGCYYDTAGLCWHHGNEETSQPYPDFCPGASLAWQAPDRTPVDKWLLRRWQEQERERQEAREEAREAHRRKWNVGGHLGKALTSVGYELEHIARAELARCLCDESTLRMQARHAMTRDAVEIWIHWWMGEQEYCAIVELDGHLLHAHGRAWQVFEALGRDIQHRIREGVRDYLKPVRR